MSVVTAPPLRIIKGDPTDEEVAALVAVLTARATAVQAVSLPERPSVWALRSRAMRRPLAHGPGAWQASALPW